MSGKPAATCKGPDARSPVLDQGSVHVGERRSPELATGEALQRVCEHLDDLQPVGVGYVALVFDREAGRSMTYVTNGRLGDAIRAMQEFVRREGILMEIDLQRFAGALDRQMVLGGRGRLRPRREVTMPTPEDYFVRGLLAPDRMIGRRAARRRKERNDLLRTALSHQGSGRSPASLARSCEAWLVRHKPEAYDRLFPRRVNRKTGEPLPRVTRDAVLEAMGKKRPRRRA